MPTAQDRMETPMAGKRIVPNIASDQLDKAKSFYAEILDMDVVMDLGWIVTFAAAASTNPQVSVATEGGSGTPVPDLSVEVDNFDEVLLGGGGGGGGWVCVVGGGGGWVGGVLW